MVTSVTASFEHENNAEEFWGEFRARIELLNHDSELARNCRKLLEDGSVELTDANSIQEFDDFVHSIPGFSDGPAYAPDAIFTPNE